MGRHSAPYNSSAESAGFGPSQHPYLQEQPASQPQSPHVYASVPHDTALTAAEVAAIDADYTARLDEAFGPDAGTKGFLLNPDWIQRARERNPYADGILAQHGLPALEEVIIPGSDGASRSAAYARQSYSEIVRPEDATTPYGPEVGEKYGFLANPDYVDHYNENREYGESRLEPGMVVDQRFTQGSEHPQTQQPPAGTFYMPIENV